LKGLLAVLRFSDLFGGDSPFQVIVGYENIRKSPLHSLDYAIVSDFEGAVVRVVVGVG
jgi:hypothetical protein